MPNLPISGLPAASSLTGTELFAAVQSGITKYTTLDNISNYVTSSIDTGSFMITGSSTGNTLTFTKGDGSTFNLYITPGGAFPITYGLFNQTGSSSPVTGSGTGAIVSGSLIDGGIGTLTVPANGFSKGDAFSVAASGIITSANNHNFEIQIKTGNTILVDTGIFELAQATNKGWVLDINFSIQETGSAGTAKIVTSGIFHYRTDSGGNVEGEIFNFINSSSFDTTISNTLDVEAVWGTDGAITDSVYSNIFTLTKTY